MRPRLQVGSALGNPTVREQVPTCSFFYPTLQQSNDKETVDAAYSMALARRLHDEYMIPWDVLLDLSLVDRDLLLGDFITLSGKTGMGDVVRAKGIVLDVVGSCLQRMVSVVYGALPRNRHCTPSSAFRLANNGSPKFQIKRSHIRQGFEANSHGCLVRGKLRGGVRRYLRQIRGDSHPVRVLLPSYLAEISNCETQTKTPWILIVFRMRTKYPFTNAETWDAAFGGLTGVDLVENKNDQAKLATIDPEKNLYIKAERFTYKAQGM